MSATMVRQGGQVWLEKSDMRLTLNKANRAKAGFLHAAIREMQYLIKKPHAKVQEEKEWAVEFPGHRKEKAATESHPAMLRQNHTDEYLTRPNGNTQNPQTRWRHKEAGAPLPNQH